MPGMGCWRKLRLLLLLGCLSTSASMAADTLSVGESLTGNQTLVSEGGKFELGFFSPAPGDSSYYVGIWYKQIPVRTVIWVMNRDRPVSGDPSSSELSVAPDGNLVLLQNKKPVWWSTRTSNGPVVAVLDDTGNLVVRGNSSEVIWQSFDHPADTLLPGMGIGLNRSTGAYQALVSWRSTADPSTGLYMTRVDPSGSGQYTLLWNGTTVYHYIGAWIGKYFASAPEMGVSGRFKFNFVNNHREVNFSFEVLKPSTLSRLVMLPNGQLHMLDWTIDSGKWVLQLHFEAPIFLCEVYAVCGPFGVCDKGSPQYCRCLPAFDAASPSPGEGRGCARKTSLNCSSNGASTDGFLPVQNVKPPRGNSISTAADAGSSSRDCASACLRNCSCTAYAYGEGGCFVWFGDLRNIQQQLPGDREGGGSTLFLRVAAGDLSTLLTPSSNHDDILVVSWVSLVTILCCCFLSVAAWRWRRGTKTVQHDGPLLVYSHGYLARCTNNFSHKLGMGSFGSVYKGTLRDHTEVAVKRLEGSAQGGEKQFRTEVRTLGTIHHVNLVRLRGFCATRRQRLLVYDYMPNGSLASAMTGLSGPLDWRARFGIMTGVARGLAYLHEHCQERIVHCDVKPENILLDAALCPKVADLGMAKLIGRDFSRALTTARGTVGYLAPEWIMGLPITSKADVYSYGMTLLELVSGRRNRDDGGRGVGYFPLWAATKVSQGQFAALLDERLVWAGDAAMEELSRACNVACWCIQESEEMRPTMGQVVMILEGSLTVGTAPVPMHLEMLCAEEDSPTQTP